MEDLITDLETELKILEDGVKTIPSSCKNENYLIEIASQLGTLQSLVNSRIMTLREVISKHKII